MNTPALPKGWEHVAREQTEKNDGMIPVPHLRVTKVRWGSTNLQYFILFYEDRLLVLKVGGQFKKGELGRILLHISGHIVGGWVGATIANEISGISMKRTSRNKSEENLSNIAQLSVDKLLGMDKHNFEMFYSDISHVEMNNSSIGINGARTGTLLLQGKRKEKFDLDATEKYNYCVHIVTTFLGDKLRQS